DRGRDEIALAAHAFRSATSERQAALTLSDLDVIQNPRLCLRFDHRPHRVAAIDWIADHDETGTGDHPFEKVIVDSLMSDRTGAGGALLTLKSKGGSDYSLS